MWEEALWECVVGTGSLFGCCKDGHKVRDFPNRAASGKEFSKICLVFWKVVLQRGIVSMHSRLEDQSWMRMMILVSSCFLLSDGFLLSGEVWLEVEF